WNAAGASAAPRYLTKYGVMLDLPVRQGWHAGERPQGQFSGMRVVAAADRAGAAGHSAAADISGRFRSTASTWRTALAELSTSAAVAELSATKRRASIAPKN